jgi:hypothetical protein
MGNLVFQAALGGTVTLVGPNTANTTSLTLPASDGTSGQALKTDGSGALSFGTLGVAGGGTGLTSTPSNGQLLIGNGTGFTAATLTAGSGVSITNGAGAITITGSGSGAFGTDLSYVNYSLTLASALGSAAASTVYMQAVSLDGTSELMILYSDASAHAVVFNTSTNTFGTPVLVRSLASQASHTVAVNAISSTSVLLCTLAVGGTALETVVLTVSGSTITVGTPVATTLSAGSSLIVPNTRLVTVGSSYVLNYNNTTGTTPKFRAITVSGSSPSVGSELAYTAGGTLALMHHSYAHSASILMTFSMTASTTVFAYPITVSGTTLTGGTAASVSTTGPSFMVTGALSNSRYALYYLNTTGRGAVVSVAGSVASISTAATTMAVVGTAPSMQVFGNQAFVLTGGSSGDSINVITDTAGVATLGTDLATTFAGGFVGYLSTSKVFLANNAAGNGAYNQYGISSGSAVLEKAFPSTSSASVVTTRVPGTALYPRPLSGMPQSGSGNTISLRTSAGKIAPASSNSLPFAVSIDGTYPAKLQQSANPYSATYNDGIFESIAWGFPSTQSGTTTTVQLIKVTLA